MKIPLVAALVVAALTAPGAFAGCTPTTTVADIDTGPTPAGRFYYIEDCGAIRWSGCQVFFSAYSYQEANGIPGLQRADEHRDDTCGGQIPGDHIFL